MLKNTFIICFLLLLVTAFSPLFAATPIMVEKNLFSQDRKPPVPQNGSTSPDRTGQAMAIGNIQLDGVVFRNNTRKAVLRLKNAPVGPTGQADKPQQPFLTVRVGEMVNDYRVAKIEIQSVTLEKGGQMYTLGLFSSNRVAAPASPQPAPSAPASAGGRPALPMPQGAIGKNPARPAPVYQKGFRPQTLHGRMSMQPNPGAVNSAPNGSPMQGMPAPAAAPNQQ